MCIRSRVLATIVLALSLAAGAPQPAYAQSAQQLFQRALDAERGTGKLTQAIALYDSVIKRAGGDRALAARALLRMGNAYELLGRTEARAAYERVVRDFADQLDMVGQARSRIAALEVAVGLVGDARPSASARRIGDGNVVGWGAPSGDGRRLSYTDAKTGNLALFDLHRGTSKLLTASPADSAWYSFAEHSVISPDGRWVAYGWWTEGTRGYALGIVDTAGTRRRVLLSADDIAHVKPFDFTPDSRHVLAAVQRVSGSYELLLVDVADGSVRNVAALSEYPMHADISPDGKHLALDLPQPLDAMARDIYVQRFADGTRTAVVAHPANDTWPLWTPDGQGLVFQSDRMGTTGAWLVDVVDGAPRGEPKLLRPDMNRVDPIGLTRDGSFFYNVRRSVRDVYAVPVDLGTGRLDAPISLSKHYVGTQYQPDWSPDGESIVFVAIVGPSSGPNARRLCVLRLVGQALTEFRLPLRFFHRPRWSPDGRALVVYGAALNGLHGVFRVDATTGAVTTLVELPVGTYAHAAVWARDGSGVFYVANERNATQYVMYHDLRSGTSREIYRTTPGDGGINDLASSPDGSEIAFRNYSTGHGTRIAIASKAGVRITVPAQVAGFKGIHWSLDGNSLFYFVGRRDNIAELWTVAASGGTPRKLHAELSSRFSDARLSPDGKRFIWSAGEGEDEIWVLDRILR